MALIETTVEERVILPCSHGDNRLEIAEHENDLEILCTFCQASVRIPKECPACNHTITDSAPPKREYRYG